jgi:membrane protease subunit HflK
METSDHPLPASPEPEEAKPGWFGQATAILSDKLHTLGLHDKGWRLWLPLLGIIWLSSSIYKVQPDEQGVVLRFGRWVDTTEPGLHFHLPFPLETVLLPQVTHINEVRLGGGNLSTDDPHSRQMLTGDENIVEADCSVSWKIKDAGKFLFSIKNPELNVKVAAESALREIISRTPIQSTMSDKRQQVADQTRDLLQNILDIEDAGILVTQVQLQRVDPPTEVIDAFNDVQRARADQERARNDAQAYSNDILPKARGEADKITQDAEAYKAQVINLAEGEAQSFTALYTSYLKHKDVTAWRLYLDGVDGMLKKAKRVMIDATGKGGASVVPYMQLNSQDAPISKGKAP